MYFQQAKKMLTRKIVAPETFWQLIRPAFSRHLHTLITGDDWQVSVTDL